MNRYKQIILSLVFIFAISFENVQAFNPNLAAKLQDTLDLYVASFSNTKGMSASVFYPGQGVWTGTSGLSYSGQPITSDMEFGIASNTKLFTAVAIVKLV